MMRTLTPIISVVIALVAYFFFTRPILDGVDTTKAEISQYEQATAQAKELNQVLKTLLDTKKMYSTTDQEHLDALVPTSVDEVKRLVDLKEMARSHNMLIGNISVTKSKAAATVPGGNDTQHIVPESFTTSDISFSLIGTYDQFKVMLQDIERSLVMLEVVHISFSSNQGNLQQFDMSVRAFGLPTEKN